jgi:hypothetical protein
MIRCVKERFLQDNPISEAWWRTWDTRGSGADTVVTILKRARWARSAYNTPTYKRVYRPPMYYGMRIKKLFLELSWVDFDERESHLRKFFNTELNEADYHKDQRVIYTVEPQLKAKRYR